MSESALRKTFRLSDRVSLEITAAAVGMIFEWDPGVPEKLTPSELEAYTAAHWEMLAMAAVWGSVLIEGGVAGHA